MGAVVPIVVLIRHAAALRRVERASLPPVAELAAVRRDLERRVGPTVSRAVAARLLDVSQTALDRWLSGTQEIPWVLTRPGRREVPLHALLDLMDDVARTPGERPLGKVIAERRRRAAELDAESVLPSPLPQDGPLHAHRRAELIGLALHRALARRLDEQTVRDARELLASWEDDGRIDPRLAEAWRDVLSGPVDEVAARISSDSQASRDLRQSSPLAGALTVQERRRALEIVAAA